MTSALGGWLKSSGRPRSSSSRAWTASRCSPLLAHLRAHAGALGIDATRPGVWAASGNVPTALHLLMTEPPGTFRAAALLYGYMLDVPAAAEAFDSDASRRTIRQVLEFLHRELTHERAFDWLLQGGIHDTPCSSFVPSGAPQGALRMGALSPRRALRSPARRLLRRRGHGRGRRGRRNVDRPRRRPGRPRRELARRRPSRRGRDGRRGAGIVLAWQGKITGFRIRLEGTAPDGARVHFVTNLSDGVSPFIAATLNQTQEYSIADARVPLDWDVGGASPAGGAYINSDGWITASNAFGITGQVYAISDGTSTTQTGNLYSNGKYCVSGTFTGAPPRSSTTWPRTSTKTAASPASSRRTAPSAARWR